MQLRLKGVPTLATDKNAPQLVRGGTFEIFTTGASRFDLRDPYHIIATMTWPMFFAALIASELVINFGFALLYTVVPGSIANVAPGSLGDAFFFSIETLATVGYGAMVPATRYGHIVSAVEIFCGMIYTAVVTGVVFIRFSRPKAKIVYADHPVVGNHNGCPTLMIRIANGRTHMLADAAVKLSVLLLEISPEGHSFRRIHTLELLRPDFPIFAITWTLMHRLDEKSPLFRCTSESLIRDGSRLILSIQARDPALAAQVHDIKNYEPETVAFGMRYVDAVSRDEAGRTSADIRRVSLIEPDLPSA